jgi:hypothetical protein
LTRNLEVVGENGFRVKPGMTVEERFEGHLSDGDYLGVMARS